MKKLISVLLATVIFLSLPFTADAAGTTRNPDNLINMIPVFHSNETGEYSSLNPWPGGELGDTVKEVMSLIRNDMSDFEKARIIYDWMTENVRYVNGRHSIANALVGRGATCMGYTLAYGYLLTHAGVEAISFYGAVTTNRASNAGHSWNLVKINGGWYHVDTTWGTAGQYTYFMLSDEVMTDAGRRWEKDTVPSTPANSLVPIGTGNDLSKTNIIFKGESAFFIDGESIKTHNITTNRTTTLMEGYPVSLVSAGDYVFYRSGISDNRTGAFYDPRTNRAFPVPADLISSALTQVWISGVRQVDEPIAVHGDLAFFFIRRNNAPRLDTSSWTYTSWGTRIYDYITDPGFNITLDVFNIKTGEAQPHTITDNDSSRLSFAGIRNNKLYFYNENDYYQFNIRRNHFTRLDRSAYAVVEIDNPPGSLFGVEIVTVNGRTYIQSARSTTRDAETNKIIYTVGRYDITTCDCCPSTQDALQILRYVAGSSSLADELRVKYDLDDAVGTGNALDVLKLVAGVA